MDISPPLIENDVIYSPTIIRVGEDIVISFTSSGESFFPITAIEGSVGQDLISLPSIPPPFDIFSLLVSYDQEASAPIIDDGQVFSPGVATVIVDLVPIDATVFYSPTVTDATMFSVFDAGYMLPFSVSAYSSVSLPVIDDSVVYSFAVEQTSARITLPSLGDTLRMYTPLVMYERMSPIRFKAAQTVFGGNITSDNISSLQEYVNVKPSSTYELPTDFIRSTVANLMPDYIQSQDALFSKTYYRAFYIRNDSPVDTRRNIDFWVDGGSTYTIRNTRGTKTINEGYWPFKLEEEAAAADLSDKIDDIVLTGAQRTSLFGFLDVSYVVYDELYEVGEDGIGVGVNLTKERFTPGNVKTRIPVLNPGEYKGIYLKIVTKFNPYFPISNDYAFLHLEYSSDSTGFREGYPRQSKLEGAPVGIVLPSVALVVRTKYEGINTHINQEIDKLYNKYPPYFLHYEDVD